MKCLNMGMRREAVQDERGVPGNKGGKEGGDEEMNNYVNEMPHEQIFEVFLITLKESPAVLKLI